MVTGMATSRIRATMDRVAQTWSDPTDEQLFDLISELNLSHQFLIVDRADAPNAEYFMQVRITDDFSRYDIEYRDGGPRAHFRAEVRRDNEFAAHRITAGILAGWARDRSGWPAD